MEMREQVQKASSGDKQAFAALYSQVYQDLYRFALYTLKNTQDAEDVVADTVISAYEQIGKLREAEAFRGWIFKILSNLCKRKLKEYVNKTVELPEDLAAKEVDLAGNAQVRDAFWKLEDEDRMIVSMHLFAGYTSQEMGDILHMNHNTVRSKESRALAKMEQYMSEGR